MEDHGVLVINGTAAFTDNTAEHGGAIYLSSRRRGAQVINGTVAFTNNMAGSLGGTIYLSPRGKVSLGGEIMFKNNTSEYGGAVHGEGSIIIQGIDTFIGNSAFRGGAISSLGVNAGNISSRYLLHSKYCFLLLRGRSILVINGTVAFTENTAVQGGAIYLSLIGRGDLVIHGTVTFTDNTTLFHGGAIYSSTRGRVHLDGEVMFNFQL